MMTEYINLLMLVAYENAQYVTPVGRNPVRQVIQREIWLDNTGQHWITTNVQSGNMEDLPDTRVDGGAYKNLTVFELPARDDPTWHYTEAYQKL